MHPIENTMQTVEDGRLLVCACVRLYVCFHLSYTRICDPRVYVYTSRILQQSPDLA